MITNGIFELLNVILAPFNAFVKPVSCLLHLCLDHIKLRSVGMPNTQRPRLRFLMISPL
jgi:hypothetical protein